MKKRKEKVWVSCSHYNLQVNNSAHPPKLLLHNFTTPASLLSLSHSGSDSEAQLSARAPSRANLKPFFLLFFLKNNYLKFIIQYLWSMLSSCTCYLFFPSSSLLNILYTISPSQSFLKLVSYSRRGAGYSLKTYLDGFAWGRRGGRGSRIPQRRRGPWLALLYLLGFWVLPSFQGHFLPPRSRGLFQTKIDG